MNKKFCEYKPASLRVLSSFLFAQKKRCVICAQRVRFPIKVGADLIIQVGSDSILLYSVMYKFVTTYLEYKNTL